MHRFLSLCTMTFIMASTLSSFAETKRPQYSLIKSSRILDIRSGQVLSNQAILVEDERIKAIGPATQIAKQASIYKTIDLGNQLVMPGLIDTHVHLTYKAEDVDDWSLISMPRYALMGARSAIRTLKAGFTSVRNLGSPGYSGIALRDAINDGDVPGPRLQAAGNFIGMTGGHCDDNSFRPGMKHKEDGVADGPWAIRSKVRENVKYGADLIKFCATGGVFTKGDLPGTQEYTYKEMKALVDEAHKMGKKVAAHAHGASGIKTAIKAGVDSVEHVSLLDREGIDLARKHGTYFVMDVYNDTYILEQGEKGLLPKEIIEKEKLVGQTQRDNFQRAWKAGVKMAFGSDAGIYPHGNNAKQFFYMVKYGMKPIEALQAATIHASALMGWEKEVGALEVGKFADIIAVNGNPLNDVQILETQVTFVMKGGKIYRQ